MECSLRCSWRASLVVLALFVVGCSATRKEAGAPACRDPLQAVEANEEGLKHVKNGQLEQAEDCFRRAIAADLFYAPAHNNLGLVLLEQKKYYEAASQFEYAGKLAPRSAEPRANLGLLFEAVGRWQEAAGQYEQALAVEPENFAVMGHLARTLIKVGKKDGRLKGLLERLVVAGEAPDWNEWARTQLVRLGQER